MPKPLPAGGVEADAEVVVGTDGEVCVAALDDGGGVGRGVEPGLVEGGKDRGGATLFARAVDAIVPDDVGGGAAGAGAPGVVS